TFVRETEQLDFVEAVERLAARAGITLRYDNANVGKDRKRKERLSEVVGAAIAFYHRLLLEAPEGGSGRKHLPSRTFEADPPPHRPVGSGPRRLRRSGGAPATGGVRAQGHPGRGPGVREPRQQAPGPVPIAAHVPDLRLARRARRLRRARPRGPDAEVQELAR